MERKKIVTIEYGKIVFHSISYHVLAKISSFQTKWEHNIILFLLVFDWLIYPPPLDWVNLFILHLQRSEIGAFILNKSAPALRMTISVAFGLTFWLCFYWVNLNVNKHKISCHVNLLLVWSHQAEIIIAKSLIYEQNYVAWVWIELRWSNQCCRRW